jgi:hypothetical protein
MWANVPGTTWRAEGRPTRPNTSAAVAHPCRLALCRHPLATTTQRVFDHQHIDKNGANTDRAYTVRGGRVTRSGADRAGRGFASRPNARFESYNAHLLAGITNILIVSKKLTVQKQYNYNHPTELISFNIIKTHYTYIHYI